LDDRDSKRGISVLSSAISALSGRLDSKFLTAYWLPAFVAVLGGIGILGGLVGFRQVDAWLSSRDSVAQSLSALVVLLLITMLAFVLRALTRPIVEIFGGTALPRGVAAWFTRGQIRVKTDSARLLGAASTSPESLAATRQATLWLTQVFPQDEADMMPTLFGNILATAAEHPHRAYGMVGALWWPRLSPLLPPSFQELLGGAQAPMMGLLNLSVVFFTLALVGAATLGLAGGQWVAAVVVLVGAVLLSRLCYRAAVSQAEDLGSMLRVAFDLYRSAILQQMGVEHPSDLAAERALWQRLTNTLIDLPGQGLTEAVNATSVPDSRDESGSSDPKGPPGIAHSPAE
jgi:hypothetical protein